MSIEKDAKKFLDGCRVILRDERVEGLIVTLNPTSEFEVVKTSCKENDWNEEVIGEFSIVDIVNEDNNMTVLNFKREVQDIIGRKIYFMETNVYQFLNNDDTFLDDDEDDDFCFDSAEERARREKEEEEMAEHEFERYLNNNDM